MAEIPATALKAFDHHGTPIQTGDALSLTPIDAAIYQRRGLITLRPRVRTPDAAEVITTPARRRRRRQTRDDT